MRNSSTHVKHCGNAKDRAIEIRVTDTGIGIPQDKQEEVFERFYKVDDFTQGTGLRIPICKSIAEKLGGSLKIDFTYRNVYRIIVTLPLVHA